MVKRMGGAAIPCKCKWLMMASFFASFREQNSRTRFAGASFFPSHRKTSGICECTRALRSSQLKIFERSTRSEKNGRKELSET
jgi:hypothetical protein